MFHIANQESNCSLWVVLDVWLFNNLR